MKDKSQKPGKVHFQLLGFRVRTTPDGKFGIYAGKRMFDSYLRVELAIKNLKKLVARRPTYHSQWTAFEKWLASK